MGLGVWADIEPLLIILPPIGDWSFMILNASWVQRKGPVRLASTTLFHTSMRRSSRGLPGDPEPALLNSRSSLPKASLVFANSSLTASGSPTSVLTTIVLFGQVSCLVPRFLQFFHPTPRQSHRPPVPQQSQCAPLPDSRPRPRDNRQPCHSYAIYITFYFPS